MRERLVTLVAALGALALFYVMFVGTGRSSDPAREIARPATTERRGNGYFAAAEWLLRSGIRVESLRERYTALGAPGSTLAPSGNLLVVTLPGVQVFRTEELAPLDRWIRAGNTLLVLAALEDRPDWAQVSGPVLTDDLLALTGFGVETIESRERRLRGESSVTEQEGAAALRESLRNLPQLLAEPRVLGFVPSRPHAYFEGVRRAAALSDYPALGWTVRIPYDVFVLTLARRSDTGDGVLWTRPLGRGRILLSGFASPFTNRALGLEGNARLLANIVAVTVAPEGAVLFDDLRQGLTAGYDPARFYADPRLHWTIAILLGLWLAWVLGSTRLRTPVASAPVPRETELVQASGGFYARVLTPQAAALRLCEHFLDRVRARAGLPRDGVSAWEWLERQPRLEAREIRRLRAVWETARAGGRVRLGALQDLLLHIEERIA